MREVMGAGPEYVDGDGFIAEVIRTSRRKSADIRVEEGAVSVVVPVELPTERIAQLLASKRRWIKEKIHLHGESQPANTRQYVSGEAFPYLGRNYRLKVQRGPFEPVKLLQGRLLATLPYGAEQPHMVRNALARWYKRQAESKLQEKAARYAKQIGVTPSSVNVKAFKSRWGSCSPTGHVGFNWCVMMAPNRVVDYVVVHELCHLIHHDHSANFWREVERHMPDFAERKEWLKQNSERLSF